MLLDRLRELGQERTVESTDMPSPSTPWTVALPENTEHTSRNDDEMDIVECDPDVITNDAPRISVNKSNGHISIVPSPTSTQHRSSAANGELVNGSSSSRACASNAPESSTAARRPTSVAEQDEENEQGDELPLVFLGVLIGVIPSQWYSKSLSKWQSGVETLGGRFISPPNDAVPDLVLLPLSDERSDLAVPVEDAVPDHWRKCPLAVTSWITQCVMAGKLFDLHNPDIPILGLDPLAVRLLEQRKGRPREATQLVVADSNAPSTSSNAFNGFTTKLNQMGETIASQNAALSAFVDGQGALHSQVKQMASAIATLTEQLNRSHHATSQRIDHLSGLVQQSNRHSTARDLHENSSRVYSAVTEEARKAATPNHNRDALVPPLLPERIGAEHQQKLQIASLYRSFNCDEARRLAEAVGVAPLSPQAGPLPSPPPNPDSVVHSPSENTSTTDHRPPSPPQRRLTFTFRTQGNPPKGSSDAGPSSTSMARGRSDPSRQTERSAAHGASAPPYTPVSMVDVTPTTPTQDGVPSELCHGHPGSGSVPVTTISPTELQALLRNVFSGSPIKGQELFWRKSRNIYIEHLGRRAPRRTCITHISEAGSVFPKRYAYDKIIFVSTTPNDPPLSVLFDMKEKEVVVYDTVDRYRNNLFTFANEKKLAETFGLKDASWYVVELVAKTEKEDAFSLVCLATKIFACRDRKSFRDLFPPHVVVAKKNIKNPIPARRQAKADYYWRLVRPRVVQHLVKELSAVLITRYRHEETSWIDVPKCSEWVDGLVRFEDSEEAKELPDSRAQKGEHSEGSRPASRTERDSASPVASMGYLPKRPTEDGASADEAAAAKKQRLYYA